ncbi:MAG: hypothetical protein V7711_15695 [Pseudomonadales bacterium]
MEKVDRKRLVETCTALKRLPHLYEKAQLFWGYPAFFDFVDDVLVMEPGLTRQGLPSDVYAELERLRMAFIRYPEEISSPFLARDERERLKTIIDQESLRKSSIILDRH